MDIDRLMIEWNEQKFEGHLFETPPSEFTAKIEQLSKRRDRRYKLQNYAGIALAVIVAVATVVAIYFEHSLLRRAGTLLTMSAVFYELLWLLKWTAEERGKPRYRPMKTCLMEERETIRKKIMQFRRQLIFYGIAAPVGLVLLFLPLGTTTTEGPLDFILGFVVALLLIRLFYLISERDELPRQLRLVEREIEKFERAYGA